MTQGGALTERIEHLIAPSLEAMGYDVVRVQLSGVQRVTLQIMAERRDEAPMTVDDCAEISHAVSAILDVEDPVKGAYTLEVSSPGIDRPLVRPRDFQRFAGHEAKVELDEALGGQRRFRGNLVAADDNRVRLATDQGEIELPIAHIRRAKLVLTDSLIAEAEAHAEAGQRRKQ